jgi:hypothetical protein
LAFWLWGGGMKSDRQILIPFHGLEALTIQEASYRTGLPETTLRRWTRDFGLGRRLEGYVRQWTLSKVALAMHLAGDREALGAYHRGERKAEIVARYYRSEGIADLLRGPLFVNDGSPAARDGNVPEV